MRFTRIILPVLLLLSAGSCRTTRTQPQAPPANTNAIAPQLPSSVINIPVSLSIDEIERKLNNLYQGVLYADTLLEGDNMMLRVTKNGNMDIRALNEQWLVDMPLHIWVKGRYKKDIIGGYGIDETREAQFSILVKGRTEIKVTENWEVKTYTRGYFEWQEKPSLDFGLFKLPISSFVEKAINEQIGAVSKMIDQEMEKYFDLRNNVTKIWNSMAEPVMVNEQYKAWLSVTPQSVLMSPLQTRSGMLNIRLGLRAIFDVQLGEKPAVYRPGPLPRLLPNATIDSSFTIYVGTLMPYYHADSLAKAALAGKHFEFNNHQDQIDIEEVDLFGSGEAFVIKMKFKGQSASGPFKKKAGGTLYFTGIPYYDSEDQTIKLKSVDFDVNTSDMLLKTASWLLHSAFVKQIRQQLVFPVGDQLNQAKQLGNEVLNNLPINSMAVMKGRITGIYPQEIYLDQEGIHMNIKSDGTAQVKVSGF